MKPLEGVTVLEFSTMITASFAAMMLAEQGATVIKVEPMNMGDPMRYIGANKGGISSLFANCNRGKRSIRVNLKESQGQELIRELVPQVDIFIHNFRPGVMDKLNLGSEALRELNPRLIYTAISGFGKEGPLGGAPAYDPIIQAQAGLTATQGKEEPAFFRTLICDKITAYTACQAVTCALYVREKTGAGQHIDLSMLDAGLFFVFPDGFQNHTLLDPDHVPGPLLIDLLYELTLTKDGAVTISAATDEMQMRSLIAVGMEHLLTDERLDSLALHFLPIVIQLSINTLQNNHQENENINLWYNHLIMHMKKKYKFELQADAQEHLFNFCYDDLYKKVYGKLSN